MPQDLSEINASSRREMVCPECGRRGLAENERAAQAFQGDQRILYATGCQTPQCSHHYEQGEPIPRNAIKQQMDDGGRTFDPRVLIAKASLKTFGVVLALVIIGLALFVAVSGVPGGSSGGTASAQDVDVTRDTTEFTPVSTVRNWTVFQYGSQCLASATIDGETVYIDTDGTVSSSPVQFDSCEAAENAVLDWAVDNPTNSTVEQNTQAENPESPFSIFASPNGSQYVISAKQGGEIVFLAPNGSIISNPYVYESYVNASSTFLTWNAENLGEDTGIDVSTLNPVTESELEAALEEYELGWYTDNTTATGGGGGGGGTGTPFDKNIQQNETQGNATEAETNSVSGVVTGPDGEPIEGATVKMRSELKTATTGPDGQYTFKNVTAGEHTLWVTPPSAMRESHAVPRRTTVLLDSNGDMNLANPPQSVTFFRDSNGYIANNQVDYVIPENRNINLVGNGSSIGSNITFANAANADDVRVNLSSVATSSERRIDVNSTSPVQFTARGNTQPRDPKLILHGDENSTADKITGNATSNTHTLAGNQQVENPMLMLTGFQETSDFQSHAAISGGSNSFTVGGNRDSVNQRIQLTGDTASKQVSVSGRTNHLRETVQGNINPSNVDVSINGRSNSNQRQVTGSVDDGQLTVEVNGNQNAQNVQLQLQGGTDTSYAGGWNMPDEWHPDGLDEVDGVTKTLAEPPDGESRTYHVEISGNYMDQEYDWGTQLILSKGRYGQWGNPYKQHVYYEPEYRVVQSWSTECGYCKYGGPRPPIDFEQNVTTSGKLQITWLYAAYDYGTVTVDVEQVEKTRTVDVSGPGVSGTVSKSVGGSGTATINIGSLSPGTHTFDLQTSGAAPVEYELDFTERYVTDNVRVSGSSGVICNKGQLAGSATCDAGGSELAPGSALDVTSSGPAPDVSLSYTARAGVDTGTISVGGQTVNYDSSNSGMDTLTSDETHEMSVSSLSPGQHTLDVAASTVDGMTPTLAATVEYQERTATKNVQLKHDGSVLCQQSGVVLGTSECDMSGSTLEGGDKVTVRADGLPVDYELGYGAVAEVGSASVTVDGTRYSYPADFSSTNPLGSGETASLELSSLSLGSHDISMADIETNGVSLDGKAELSYTGDVTTSYEPAVIVINSNGTSHSKPVPASQLDNGRLTSTTTVEVPQKFFAKGENKVVVRTADGSFVRADLRATGLSFQAGSFDRGANVTATG